MHRQGIVVAMLGDQGVLHRDSFAKNAAAFFRNSRSKRKRSFSRRSRRSSASGDSDGAIDGDAGAFGQRPRMTGPRKDLVDARPSRRSGHRARPAAKQPHPHIQLFAHALLGHPRGHSSVQQLNRFPLERSTVTPPEQ